MDRSVPTAIALDMDGVLLRTNDSKYRAMLGLFERYPAKTAAISQFIQGYFAEVFDGRTPKDEALELIAHRHGHKGTVFFGDSLGDLAAAQSAGVPFVAVVAEWDNFPERAVVKLRDFTDRDTIQRCVSEATQACAI